MGRAAHAAKKFLASAICGALILTAPGIDCYRALAQEWAAPAADAPENGAASAANTKIVSVPSQVSHGLEGASRAVVPLVSPRITRDIAGSLKTTVVPPVQTLGLNGAAPEVHLKNIVASAASQAGASLPSGSGEPELYSSPAILKDAVLNRSSRADASGTNTNLGSRFARALSRLGGVFSIDKLKEANLPASQALFGQKYDGLGQESVQAIVSPGISLLSPEPISASLSALSPSNNLSLQGKLSRYASITPRPRSAFAGFAPVFQTAFPARSYRSVLFPMFNTAVAAVGTVFLSLHAPLVWAIPGLAFTALLARSTVLEIQTLVRMARNEPEVNNDRQKHRLLQEAETSGIHPAIISELNNARFYRPQRPISFSKLHTAQDMGTRLRLWSSSWLRYVRELASFSYEEDHKIYFRSGYFDLPDQVRSKVRYHELTHLFRDPGRAPPVRRSVRSRILRAVLLTVTSPVWGLLWLLYRGLRAFASELYARFSEFRPQRFKTHPLSSIAPKNTEQDKSGQSGYPDVIAIKAGGQSGLLEPAEPLAVPVGNSRRESSDREPAAEQKGSPLERVMKEAGDTFELTFPYELLWAASPVTRDLKGINGFDWLNLEEIDRLSGGKAQIRYPDQSGDGKPAALGDYLNQPDYSGRFRFIVVPAGNIPKPSKLESARLEPALQALDDTKLGRFNGKAKRGKGIGVNSFLPPGIEKVASVAWSELERGGSVKQENIERAVSKYWGLLAQTALKNNAAVKILNGAYQSLDDEGRLFIPWEESREGLEAFEKLLRYWRGNDGGRFKVRRIDRPEGGHVFVVRRLRPLAEFSLKAAEGARIKKSLVNFAAGLSPEELRKRLRDVGFNDDRISEILKKRQETTALALIEAGYKKNQIDEFLKKGVEVRFILGEDIGQSRSDLIILVPRANAKAVVNLAEKEGIKIETVRYGIKKKIRDSAPALHVTEVWDFGYNGKGRLLGAVDTGWDPAPDNPDVANRQGRDTVTDRTSQNPPVRPPDPERHGDEVLGSMISEGRYFNSLAPNFVGQGTLAMGDGKQKYDPPYLGMAYGADGHMEKVFPDGGDGASNALIDAGMAGHQQLGADGQNLSLGGQGSADGPSAKAIHRVAKTPNAQGHNPIMGVAAGNEGPIPYSINELSGSPLVASVTGVTKPIKANNRLIRDPMDLFRMAFFPSVGPALYSEYLVPREEDKPDIASISGDVNARSRDPFKKGVESTNPENVPPSPSETKDRWHQRMSGTSQATPLWLAIAAGDIKSVVLAVTREGSPARKFFIENLPLSDILLTYASAGAMKVPAEFQGTGVTNAAAAAKLAVLTFGDPTLETTQELMKHFGLTQADVRGKPENWDWIREIIELLNDRQALYDKSEVPAKELKAKGEAQRRAKEEKKKPGRAEKTTQELLAENQARFEARQARKRGDKRQKDETKKQFAKDTVDYMAQAKAVAQAEFERAMREDKDENGLGVLDKAIRALNYKVEGTPKEALWLVQKTATFSLRQFKAPEALPALAELATSEQTDIRERQRSFMAIAMTPKVQKLGVEPQNEGLHQAWNQRTKMAQSEDAAMGWLRDAVAKADDKTPPDIPVYAAFALTAHGDPSGVARIVNAVKNDRAAKKLAEDAKNLDPPAVQEEILEAAKIINYGMRKTVAWMLFMMGGLTLTAAFNQMVLQGKIKKADFADTLTALLGDETEDYDVRHSAAASLGYLGWENPDPEVLPDSVLLTLLRLTTPQDAAMVMTTAQVFFIMLQDKTIAARIKGKGLQEPFTDFVMKYKAYAGHDNALGALVRKFAQILNIPVASPSSVPNDEGPNVVGVDPLAGEIQVVIEEPPSSQNHSMTVQDFSEPSGPESAQEHADRIAAANAAAAQRGLDSRFMERYKATFLAVLPTSSEFVVGLPDYKVASFIAQLEARGLKAHRAVPVYSLDQEGLPMSSWASRQGERREREAAVPVVDMGENGISEAEFKIQLERKLALMPDPLRTPSMLNFNVAVPDGAAAGFKKLATRLALENRGVFAVKEDPGVAKSGMMALSDASLIIAPDTEKILKMRVEEEQGFLRQTRRVLRGSRRVLGRFGEIIGMVQANSLQFELRPTGHEAILLEEMTQRMRRRLGGLPDGYALWMQQWLGNFVQAKKAGKEQADLGESAKILAAFESNFDSTEKAAAVRAEAGRMIQEARERYGAAVGLHSVKSTERTPDSSVRPAPRKTDPPSVPPAPKPTIRSSNVLPSATQVKLEKRFGRASLSSIPKIHILSESPRPVRFEAGTLQRNSMNGPPFENPAVPDKENIQQEKIKVYLTQQGHEPVATDLQSLRDRLASDPAYREILNANGLVRMVLNKDLKDGLVLKNIDEIQRVLTFYGITAKLDSENIPIDWKRKADAKDIASQQDSQELTNAVRDDQNRFLSRRLFRFLKRHFEELTYVGRTFINSLTWPTRSEVTVGVITKGVGFALATLWMMKLFLPVHPAAFAAYFSYLLILESFFGIWVNSWQNLQNNIGRQRGVSYQTGFNLIFMQLTAALSRIITWFSIPGTIPPWHLKYWRDMGVMAIAGTFFGTLGFQGLNTLYNKGRIGRRTRSLIQQVRDASFLLAGTFFGTGSMTAFWMLFAVQQAADLSIYLYGLKAEARPIVYIVDERIAGTNEFQGMYPVKQGSSMPSVRSAIRAVSSNPIIKFIVSVFERKRHPKKPASVSQQTALVAPYISPLSGGGPHNSAFAVPKTTGRIFPTKYDRSSFVNAENKDGDALPLPPGTPNSLADISLEIDPNRAYAPSPEDWRDEIVYSIFLDRFARGPNAKPWGDPKNGFSRHGGDIQGVISRLDYLKGLGVTALMISPVTVTVPEAYHGYAPIHLLAVDPHLGTMGDFKELVAAAHKRGLRIILDFVVNHAGPVFEYKGNSDWIGMEGPPKEIDQWMNDLKPIELAKPEHFTRRGVIDWYNLHPGEMTHGDFPPNYRHWATDNPDTQTALIQISNWWIKETDIDGVRIDAARHLDPSFMPRFAKETQGYASKLGKKNFLSLVEDASGDVEEIANDFERGANSAYNFTEYGWDDPALHGLAPTRILEDSFNWVRSHLGLAAGKMLRYLDTHDTYRFLREGEAASILKVACAFLFFSWGIPMVYYGTEQGFQQPPIAPEATNRFADPGNREDMFPEGQFKSRSSEGNKFDVQSPMYQWMQKLAKLRRAYPALTRGEQWVRWSDPQGPGIYAFSRIYAGEEVLVILNTANEKRGAAMWVDAGISPAGTKFVDKIDSHYAVSATPSEGGSQVKVEVPPRGVRVLVRHPVPARFPPH